MKENLKLNRIIVAFRGTAIFFDRWHWILLALTAPFLLFPSPQRSPAMLVVPASLLFSDLIGFLLAGFLAIAARLCLGQGWQWELYGQILPVGAVCLLFFAFAGLYPGACLGAVEELRRLSLMTTAVIFSLAGLTFFARNPEDYSRLTLGLTWLFSLVFLPLGRNLLRGLAAEWGIWGQPVLVVGYTAGGQGRQLAQHLRAHRSIGYYPVAAVDSFAAEDRLDEESGLPVFAAAGNRLELPPGLAAIQTAVLAPAEVPASLARALTRDQHGGFRRVIILPEQLGIGPLGVTAVTLNGMIGLQVHNNLSSKFARLQKRLLDLLGASLLLLLLSPILGLAALLIKLTSRGPVFYTQERVGKNGQPFGMAKFRTMRQNAHQELAGLLAGNPALQAEWDKYQKLKRDPRLTPLGNFLRCYSIDELPKLWNVLKGEMSLVGPRPFFPEQREMYGEGYSHYFHVQPGITGLWQVSERNASEFTRRAYWDEYYVCGWSLWLDIYILAKTVWVVLRREGAY